MRKPCSDCLSLLTLHRYNKTSGNNNDDLHWLATKIWQCRTIDFQALCGIFNITMADLLQHYQVKDPLNKFELIATIQTVASRSATRALSARLAQDYEGSKYKNACQSRREAQAAAPRGADADRVAQKGRGCGRA